MTSSKFSREAFVADLQARLGEASKAKAATEVELRQVRLVGTLGGRAGCSAAGADRRSA